MKPILLIHGYSSEGKNKSVEKIYGTLPAQLKKYFGNNNVKNLNLSRWISLNDGIMLDDVSFAMERALKVRFSSLLKSGFHVIIHSTGALVVRSWIKNFSPKPCPIINLVHLAGANFWSGLAHIGQGQLSRWGRLIFAGTGRGYRILNELEFGSWKTLDLHTYFLKKSNDIYNDYQVQEFCIIGSQIPALLRKVPIRYVKEDSSDNTVRTSACNLNFNYVVVKPKPEAFKLTLKKLRELLEKRQEDQSFREMNYEYNMTHLSQYRQEIPFAIAYETAHFGDDIGIVSGGENRKSVMPLIKTALETPYDKKAYQQIVDNYKTKTENTFKRVAKLKSSLLEWNKQEQYEGHAQLIIRLRDQFGNALENYDIMFKTKTRNKKLIKLESMIEDKHPNNQYEGTITYYLRTQKFKNKKWLELLDDIAPVNVEITAVEALSNDISFVPLNLALNTKQVRSILQSFRTTIIDITLVRLPSQKVFLVKKV